MHDDTPSLPTGWAGEINPSGIGYSWWVEGPWVAVSVVREVRKKETGSALTRRGAHRACRRAVAKLRAQYGAPLLVAEGRG